MGAHSHPPPAPPRGEAAARATVADIFRRFGPRYRREHVLTPAQGKVLRDVMACRTAALGGHVDVCQACGERRPSYNSCRNRHCPTCQGSQALRWIGERVDRLVSTHHFHVVFTLPAALRPVALANPKQLFDLLFDAASETLLELARSKWAALPGITAVLHTWTRQMEFHPHLHCVVTGGGLSLDDTRWVACRPRYLFPVKVMSALFRGKFLAGLQRARDAGHLRFAGTSASLAAPSEWDALRDTLHRAPFVTYAKRPFGGPEQVLRYLGRYTHRVAIGTSRLVSVEDDAIVFRTRGSRLCRLDPAEFIRRFLLHVLPDQFRKIRHYGLIAPSNVPTRLATAQRLTAALPRRALRAASEPPPVAPSTDDARCPACGGALVREVLHPARPPPQPAHPDDA